MSAAAALPTTEPQSVRSELLGDLLVAPEQLVTFPAGLHGFPDARQFALLPTPRNAIYWLQSVEFSALSFLLVDPFAAFPDRFHIDLTPDDFRRLGTDVAKHILVLAIVTLSTADEKDVTVNLRAPLLFNLEACQAYQCIRTVGEFGVREPLDLGVIGENAES